MQIVLSWLAIAATATGNRNCVLSCILMTSFWPNRRSIGWNAMYCQNDVINVRDFTRFNYGQPTQKGLHLISSWFIACLNLPYQHAYVHMCLAHCIVLYCVFLFWWVELQVMLILQTLTLIQNWLPTTSHRSRATFAFPTNHWHETLDIMNKYL